MKRREFVTLLVCTGAAYAPTVNGLAQRRTFRIGIISAVPPPATMLAAFRDGMRERGYVEGQNLSIDARWPRGTVDQDTVTAELVHAGVDVIVAWTTSAAIAARKATSTVPIVIVGVSDPVGVGLVGSLARPGGNVTGVSNLARDISGKMVELLMEIVSDLKRVGIVYNPSNPGSSIQLQGAVEAVRALGLQPDVVEGRSPDQYERGFARLSANGAKGVVLLADPTLIEHKQKIAEFASKSGLPTAFQRRENVEAGGLLSYGPNLNTQFRQTTFYVDRILKGTPPSDLPVEQPTKFELVINLKTAKMFGLQIPPKLLFTADEVIE